MEVQRLGLSHCTGEAVTNLLAQEFDEGFSITMQGRVFDLLGE